MCETRILAQTSTTEIGHCVHCKTIFLWHANILLSFSEEKFAEFRSAVHQYDFASCAMTFSDNIDRISVCTPSSDVNLVFDKLEWAALLHAIEDAAYMQEVYQILEPNQR